MQTAHPTITTAARRLTRQHNNDEQLVSGYIYLVRVETGEIVSSMVVHPAAPQWMQDAIVPYATFAAHETEEMHAKGLRLLRVGYGRITQVYAQRFLAGEVSG